MNDLKKKKFKLPVLIFPETKWMIYSTKMKK